MTPEAWRAASLRALERALDDLEARLNGTAGTLCDGEREPNALDRLVERFGLDSFERDLLLLAAGCELDGRFGALVARLSAPPATPARPFQLPTFSLALTVLEGGHWRALTPGGTLRRARLLTVGEGETLTLSPLAIEEAVLHGLTGLPQVDERLRPFLLPQTAPETLTPGQERAVARLVRVWSGGAGEVPPVAQLTGADPLAGRAVAAAACRRLGLAPFLLDLEELPADPAARDDLLALWLRDAVLGDFALLVEPAAAPAAARWWLERCPGFVAALGDAAPPAARRGAVRIAVPSPVAGEQKSLWAAALGLRAERLDGRLERLVQQFTLPPAAIAAVAAETAGQADDADGDARALWRACRRRARGGLDELAQRIETVAGWDDLVLPPAQLATLRQIESHVRQRARVYEEWGFASRGRRGLGISALFAGASGTGKTTAAEVLARELDLDLYRIDLSATVSKYVGETEKNLRRVFDAAEASGALLLFDEADALFGKRSEVRDSHDRYANLEISYLLQRIESYRGLAILTTNLKRHLDDAFTRRLRFIVDFPHPGPAERRELWRRVFPRQTPRAGLDVDKLARLSITGGHVKSIALHAAVLAAEEDAAVAMGHVLEAARAEYAKQGKPLSESEVKGWL